MKLGRTKAEKDGPRMRMKGSMIKGSAGGHQFSDKTWEKNWPI